jgi:hypothetical protein
LPEQGTILVVQLLLGLCHVEVVRWAKLHLLRMFDLDVSKLRRGRMLQNGEKDDLSTMWLTLEHVHRKGKIMIQPAVYIQFQVVVGNCAVEMLKPAKFDCGSK